MLWSEHLNNVIAQSVPCPCIQNDHQFIKSVQDQYFAIFIKCIVISREDEDV